MRFIFECVNIDCSLEDGKTFFFQVCLRGTLLGGTCQIGDLDFSSEVWGDIDLFPNLFECVKRLQCQECQKRVVLTMTLEQRKHTRPSATVACAAFALSLPRRN